jgi:hypothetical protein
MALINFTLPEMVGYARIATLPPVRLLIVAIAGTAGILAELDDFLTDPGVARHPASESELPALDLELIVADRDFDRVVRGGVKTLEGLADLSRSEATARSLNTLSLHLFPEGQALVNRTYLAEAAVAETVDERLTAEDVALLQRVKLLDVEDLGVEVTDWKATGATLRDLDTRRARLRQAEIAASPLGTALIARRNRWIKAIKHLRSVLEFDATGTDETRGAILSKLDEAEAHADERERKRVAALNASLTA